MINEDLFTYLIFYNMTKMKHLLSQLYLLALLALPVFVASCSEEDAEEGSQELKVAIAGITDGSTVNVGGTVTMSALIESETIDPIYSWKINGEEVSTGDKLTFSPEEKGTYNITLMVTDIEQTKGASLTLNAQLYPAQFYVINEGQYGKGASVNRYAGQTWQNRIIEGLGETGTVADADENYMYVVTKTAPQLTKVEKEGYTTAGSLSLSSGVANNLLILNDLQAILTTDGGAYTVNLSTMELGEKLEGTSNSTDIHRNYGHLFIIDQKVIKVYSAETLTLEQTFPYQTTTGFAQAKDEKTLWAANGTKLIKINMETLESEEIELPDNLSVYYNSMAYTPTCLQASTTEEALYFTMPDGFNGKNIYKYNTKTGEAMLFFAAPEGKMTYGSCIQVDPYNGDVYLLYVQNDYSPIAGIYIVDGVSGEQKAKLDYSGEYWFPSSILFE